MISTRTSFRLSVCCFCSSLLFLVLASCVVPILVNKMMAFTWHHTVYREVYVDL